MDIKFAGLRSGEFVVNQNSSGRHFTKSMGGGQAFSQKGVQASWDAPRTKNGRPNSGGKGKLFSIISLSILYI